MKMLGKKKALFIRINEETSQDSFKLAKCQNGERNKSLHV